MLIVCKLSVIMSIKCIMLLCSLWHFISANKLTNKIDPTKVDYYGPSPYNLEDYCNEKDDIEFFIDPWKAAIFQVGHLFKNNRSSLSRKIHKCKITIKTSKKFWLVAAIEHMKIRGNKDASNKWICSDYVQFSSPSRNLFNKVFKVFDIDLSPKKSDKLCGDKRLDGDHLDLIFDISTDANSFSTTNHEMSILFHQDNDDRHTLNNSFIIVVTTFRHASEQVECEGKQKCYGREIFCIDKNLICDGHVNCAFPGAGTDEILCRGKNPPKIFDTTSVIIIILTSMVSFGILICIISSIKNRLNSEQRLSRRQSNNVSMPYYPNAPRLENEAPLPPYESVILADSDGGKDPPFVFQEEGESPPNYESLFPEDPPPPPQSSNSLKDESIITS